jgi:hypothetical protein
VATVNNENADETAEINLENIENSQAENSSEYEVIVKYSDDISNISDELQAKVEILIQGYAIITLDKSKVPALYNYPQIIGIELPKNIYIASSFDLTANMCSGGSG